MPVLGCVHVLVRRVRPWQLAICGHVERDIKQRLEIVLQRVKMTGEKETMVCEETSASDALLERATCQSISRLRGFHVDVAVEDEVRGRRIRTNAVRHISQHNRRLSPRGDKLRYRSGGQNGS